LNEKPSDIALKESEHFVPTISAEEAGDAEDDDDAAICWICAEPVKYYSVAECNHRTCHVCALRLRALYKKLNCAFCKVRLSYFIVFKPEFAF
jgi:hypothetical protein